MGLAGKSENNCAPTSSRDMGPLFEGWQMDQYGFIPNCQILGMMEWFFESAMPDRPVAGRVAITAMCHVKRHTGHQSGRESSTRHPMHCGL